MRGSGVARALAIDARSAWRALALTLSIASTAAFTVGGVTAQDVPRDSSLPTELVEETESRLTQIDVTVSGPPDLVAGLGREDFRLKVHMQWLNDFEVDRYCVRPGEEVDAIAPAAPRPTLSVLFYFDQPHLTSPGRARAIDTARRLIPPLVANGHRAMIVSNAARLTVIEEWTADAQRLLEALDRLENDRSQWDLYASEEGSRIARIVDVLNTDQNVFRAVGLARSFQREEHVRTDRSLRRLQFTLARMSEIDSRKAVVYLADTLRQNPGEHYVSFFGLRVKRATASLGQMTSEAFAAGVVFDKVINEAVSHGIRFYPVFGRGLISPFERERVDAPAVTRSGGTASSSRVRFRDAQKTLANMASETGGHVFLRGESATRIAEAMLADLACVYTLSFDPTGFPEDEPLRVIVQAVPKGVRLRTRGRTVFQSQARRLSARLLTAFAAGQPNGTDLALRANLVPTGFERGAYAALLQLSVPGTALSDAHWDLGASLIHRERVLDEVSGALEVGRPGVPLVLERELTIRPGPHEIVAVAHESSLDVVLSEHLQLSWPDPNRQSVTCGPLALLQPAAGAFARGEDTRTAGSLARSVDEPVSDGLPTALMGLVCRSRRHKGVLNIERVLIGDSAVEFPPLQFELGSERCAQIRDLIPARSLRVGSYRYVLRALRDGAVLHEVSREFIVTSSEI